MMFGEETVSAHICRRDWAKRLKKHLIEVFVLTYRGDCGNIV